jgi:PAS domain S-box-containing protein
MTPMKRTAPPQARADVARLRADAEAQVARDPAAARPARSASELTHELQVHRIELEMQNEELRRAYTALEAARDRYVDLYDFAPVGHLTLDRDGLITEANLTAAGQLGIERARLVGRRFARQVAALDQDRWHRHALAQGRSDAPSRIELLLLGPDGRHWHAQLDSLRVQTPDAGPMLRLALTDISARKRAELYQRAAAAANAAREADNRRLALQLHEDLGQGLCALKLELDDLHGSEDRPARQARLAAMRSEVDQAVAMVRRMSAELRPAMLDDLGLNAAIEWLVHDTAARLGIAVSLKQDDIEPPLEPASAVAIYRLVQAVLDRLPGRQRVGDVVLSVRRQMPGMVVCLQAQGLVLGKVQDATALSERTLALGGKLALESDAPGGACITVFVPLEPAQAGRPLRLIGAWS